MSTQKPMHAVKLHRGGDHCQFYNLNTAGFSKNKSILMEWGRKRRAGKEDGEGKEDRGEVIERTKKGKKKEGDRGERGRREKGEKRRGEEKKGRERRQGRGTKKRKWEEREEREWGGEGAG